MQQTKLESLIEQIINVGSGFFIALLTWILIVKPVWNIDVNMFDNFLITILFTFISVIRGFFWRRFFNAGLHKWVHNLIKKRYF